MSIVTEDQVALVAAALSANGWNAGGDDEEFANDVRVALEMYEAAKAEKPATVDDALITDKEWTL